MKFKNGAIPGHRKISKIPDLSREARARLKWFDYYYANGRNARKTCTHFDISAQTFYRWKRRYCPEKLETLEARSHLAKRRRHPTWSPEMANAVLKLREENPRWGKEKLAPLLREQGCRISTSMVGRILKRLKDRGVLREPVSNPISARKRVRKRPYAIRKPGDYQIIKPGDLIQVDTMDVRPMPGVVLKHFTAHDVVSKWNVLSVYTSATATNASNFLDLMKQRMPFSIGAVQVDGGSEFESIFEEKCQQDGIRLFALPPRSPKLNGAVERAHRTHAEEFYEITNSDFTLPALRKALLEWEMRYNTVRPHQSLAYVTPGKFLAQSNFQKREEKCH